MILQSARSTPLTYTRRLRVARRGGTSDGGPGTVRNISAQRGGIAPLTPMPLVEPLEARVVLSTSLSPAAVAAAGATPPAQVVAGSQPSVISVSPKTSTLNVALDSFVSAEV